MAAVAARRLMLERVATATQNSRCKKPARREREREKRKGCCHDLPHTTETELAAILGSALSCTLNDDYFSTTTTTETNVMREEERRAYLRPMHAHAGNRAVQFIEAQSIDTLRCIFNAASSSCGRSIIMFMHTCFFLSFISFFFCCYFALCV